MYIELHSRSAFSFLRGASQPEHLAEAAAELGMPALALCDRDGVYGAPRFFAKARELGLRPIIGAELTLEDGCILPVLVESRAGYRNLCRLLTRAHLRSEKGKCAVRWNELPEFTEGLIALTGEAGMECWSNGVMGRNHHSTTPSLHHSSAIERLLHIFGSRNLCVELQRHHVRGEERALRSLVQWARHYNLPLLATNGVQYAKPYGRQVLDVFTCIRHHTHLDAAGKLLEQNGERYLKSPAQMRELFRDLPEAIDNTVRLADRLQFSLDNLGYEFPSYPVRDGECMDNVLRRQTYAGARHRYGTVPDKVRRQMEHELALIQKLGFAGYFLIVADIINFCRDNDIMAQGRGSAANSTVCFCLGITAVDPLKFNTLFERFLSEGRKGWPDIDIDLPSGDRRERVIQEVYRRYGKHGAAMTANVITYRGRSAAREIGKALNVSNDVLDRFSNLFANGDFPHTLDFEGQLEQAGLSREHPRARAFGVLYRRIYGLPRHLGQHSGGMIICQGKLDSIVPLENASMPGRVVAQWDKDDCEDLGIIKVDLLGLGMMSVLQDAIRLTHERGHPVDLAKIPLDDARTFDMMQKADTIGVFQVESRAQMATLPRMKPKSFYDVVIEVALIRPGPIQGDMVHPFLARRSGKEKVTYFDERLKPVLERTMGVPLFQEQILQIAMVMADFTGSEAEELRRALSFHRSEERMAKVCAKLRERMLSKGVPPDDAEKIIQSVSSFALYGFPESHAISFAILAYGSAYLKAHYAPEFYASLLNNQPMGFYSPATIVKDAKRHGVQVRPVCVMRSNWHCKIEPDNSIRLGLCVVQGLQHAHAMQVLDERDKRPFTSMDDFKLRTLLNKTELRTLAEIGALNCFVAHRRDALWEVEREVESDDLFAESRSRQWTINDAVASFIVTDRSAQHDLLPAANSGESGQLPVNSGDGCLPKKDAAALFFGSCQLQLSLSETEEKPSSPLSPMTVTERLEADYNGMSLTTGPHPMSLLRPQLRNVWRATDLLKAKHGQRVRIAGNVICRQRPGTAKGFVFISLEDETGVSNAIVAPRLFEKLRLVITQERFLIIEGRLQNQENVITIKAERIERLAQDLAGAESHDFR